VPPVSIHPPLPVPALIQVWRPPSPHQALSAASHGQIPIPGQATFRYPLPDLEGGSEGPIGRYCVVGLGLGLSPS